MGRDRRIMSEVGRTERRTIAIVGNFGFPNNNASGLRVLANGHLFRAIGYKVIYIGLEKVTEDSTSTHHLPRCYDGFQYCNFCYPAKISEWLFSRGRMSGLLGILRKNNVTIVVS